MMSQDAGQYVLIPVIDRKLGNLHDLGMSG